MIPTIETILADLMNSRITFQQAMDLINQHLVLAQENADLRDHFAGLALQGLISKRSGMYISEAKAAYQIADAMLEARVA